LKSMVPAKLALALTLFPVGSRFLPARAKRGWPPQGKPLAARARHRRGVNLRAGNRSAIER